MTHRGGHAEYGVGRAAEIAGARAVGAHDHGRRAPVGGASRGERCRAGRAAGRAARRRRWGARGRGPRGRCGGRERGGRGARQEGRRGADATRRAQRRAATRTAARDFSPTARRTLRVVDGGVLTAHVPNPRRPWARQRGRSHTTLTTSCCAGRAGPAARASGPTARRSFATKYTYDSGANSHEKRALSAPRAAAVLYW